MSDTGPGFQLPARPPQTPGFPSNFQYLALEQFAGLNTKPTRSAIKDQEMSWCDNWMPLGDRNLRTLPDIGDALYTAPNSITVAYFQFGNLGDTPLMVVFLSDGSIQQVATITGDVTQIAPAGTIVTPTNARAVSQWGSQYILIVAPQSNGYFIWDGTLFYEAGTIGPFVSISNGGLDYTSQPTITPIGGKGTGATFSATITSSGSISQITALTAGSGYSPYDVVMLAFSGGGSTTTAIATANISGGTIRSITVNNKGSGYDSPATTTVSIQGGGGIGATAIANVSFGQVQSIVATSGEGYLLAPTVIVSDPNNPVAEATVEIMPFGVQGTNLETYTSHVWIVNGAAPVTPPVKSLVIFSAPGSASDFSTGDGGGQFISTDSFLRAGYHAIKQSNGFLYLVGDSSINYISGVTTTGNPAITTFTNQNIDPQIGTPWPDTVQVFSRAIVFANTFGVFAIYGGAVQKVSTPLDGIYTSITPTGQTPAGLAPTFNGLVPSAAVAVVFGIHVYILLVPFLDLFTGLQRNGLYVWDGQKWWTYNPSVTLLQIATQEINSVLTAYGTDGASVYPLFQNPTTAITKIVQTKFWDKPSYIITKHGTRVFALFQQNTDEIISGTLTVDTPTQSIPVTISDTFAATWTNNAGIAANWLNNAAASVSWLTTGSALFFNSTVDAAGVLMGMTLNTSAEDLTLISLAMAPLQYRPEL